MSIPLDLLVNKERNNYEMTCVAIKNAEKITKIGEELELVEHGEKVVSVSLTQVLNDKIQYERNEEE